MFVCTGNICRSPMAEAILRARATDAGIDVSVSSAGLLFEGLPAERGAIAALERMGIEVSHHEARIIGPDILGPADLVLGMEHRHVREVVVTEGGDVERTFTLPEFVERAEAAGPRQHEDFGPWVAGLAAARTPSELMRADPRLEVIDPMGGSKRVFRQNAARIDELVRRLVAVTWPVSAPARQPADPLPDPGDRPVPPTPTRST